MKPETKNTFKENILLGASYAISKVLQFAFKVKVYLFGLEEGRNNIKRKTGRKVWTMGNPFTGAGESNWWSTFWQKERGRFHYGTYSHSARINFNTAKDNPCFWMLELDKGKVQEIDVWETMKPEGKRGLYFSIYNNEKSNKYFSDKNEVVYRRFQTRMRSDFVIDYLEAGRFNYSVKWHKNYVIWYIENMPVAISFVYVPTQPMWLILTNF